MPFEVIVPVYNEASRLELLIPPLARAAAERLKGAETARFWWADDGSTDGSLAMIEEKVRANFAAPGATHVFLRREVNEGKGSIVCHALAQVLAQAPADALVAFWDADGELDADALFDGLGLVARGEAEVAFGRRTWMTSEAMLARRLANRALTRISNVFSGLGLQDVHCCARVAKVGLLARLDFGSRGFDFEAELAGLLGKINRERPLRLREFPVAYRPRTAAQGRKIGLGDVYPQILQAIRCRYR